MATQLPKNRPSFLTDEVVPGVLVTPTRNRKIEDDVVMIHIASKGSAKRKPSLAFTFPAAAMQYAGWRAGDRITLVFNLETGWLAIDRCTKDDSGGYTLSATGTRKGRSAESLKGQVIKCQMSCTVAKSIISGVFPNGVVTIRCSYDVVKGKGGADRLLVYFGE